VVLSPGTQLFPHHLEGDTYNFGQPLAVVSAKPFGLRNLSTRRWTSRTADGSITEVAPGDLLPLISDSRISFGRTEAEMRIS
jgi:hypothetical protein